MKMELKFTSGDDLDVTDEVHKITATIDEMTGDMLKKTMDEFAKYIVAMTCDSNKLWDDYKKEKELYSELFQSIELTLRQKLL